jgi:hypothetical protein
MSKIKVTFNMTIPDGMHGEETYSREDLIEEGLIND